jgi:hypothetical protein
VHWVLLGAGSHRVTLRPEEYELTVAKKAAIVLTINAPGDDVTYEALVACYPSGGSEQLTFCKCFSRSRHLFYIHEAARRIVVLLPGFLPAEVRIGPNASGHFEAVQVRPLPGISVAIPKAAFPPHSSGPLTATATPVAIAPKDLGSLATEKEYITRFTSAFTPPDGDITFGPFTPGTYDLKIVDASGAVVWQQTKVIE